MKISLLDKIIIALVGKLAIDNKPARRAMYTFFNMHDWGGTTTITDVKVFYTEKGLTVEITTHRPGILIGKAGHFINSLKEFLEKELGEKITIDLKNCKLWLGLYS